MAKVSVVHFNLSIVCPQLVAERPQHMLMRVSVGIHSNNLDKAIEVRKHV